MTEKEQVIYQLRAAGRSVRGDMELEQMYTLYKIVYEQTCKAIEKLIKEDNDSRRDSK